MVKITYFNEIREETSEVLTDLILIDLEYMDFCCLGCALEMVDDLKDFYGDKIIDEDYDLILDVVIGYLEED